MGGRNDSPQRNDIPGPGSYEPKDHLVKDQTSAAFKMS